MRIDGNTRAQVNDSLDPKNSGLFETALRNAQKQRGGGDEMNMMKQRDERILRNDETVPL